MLICNSKGGGGGARLPISESEQRNSQTVFFLLFFLKQIDCGCQGVLFSWQNKEKDRLWNSLKSQSLERDETSGRLPVVTLGETEHDGRATGFWEPLELKCIRATPLGFGVADKQQGVGAVCVILYLQVITRRKVLGSIPDVHSLACGHPWARRPNTDLSASSWRV